MAFALSAGAYFLLRHKVFLDDPPTGWDVFLVIYLLCLILSIVISVVALVLQVRLLWGDSVYSKWTKHANCPQKAFQYTINFLSLFNFKMSHVLWSGIRSMPLLEPSQQLSFFHKPSGFSVVVSLIFTANSVLCLHFRPDLTNIYIDSMAVVVLSMLFSLLALRRPNDFFVHQLVTRPEFSLNNKRSRAEEDLLTSALKPNEGPVHFFSNRKQVIPLNESEQESVSDDSSRISIYSSGSLSMRTRSAHYSSEYIRSGSEEGVLVEAGQVLGSEDGSVSYVRDEPPGEWKSRLMDSSSSVEAGSLTVEPGRGSSIEKEMMFRASADESSDGSVEPERPTNIAMMELGQ